MSKIEYRIETLINFWSLREEARKKEETQTKTCPYCLDQLEKNNFKKISKKAA